MTLNELIKQELKNKKSDCCNVGVKLNLSEKEMERKKDRSVTIYYRCIKCNKPCDLKEWKKKYKE